MACCLSSAKLRARVAELSLKQKLASEPRAQRWALMSERGCEAADLTLDEAAALRRRLNQEKVYGLAIITNEAALRLISSDDTSTKTASST